MLQNYLHPVDVFILRGQFFCLSMYARGFSLLTLWPSYVQHRLGVFAAKCFDRIIFYTYLYRSYLHIDFCSSSTRRYITEYVFRLSWFTEVCLLYVNAADIFKLSYKCVLFLLSMPALLWETGYRCTCCVWRHSAIQWQPPSGYELFRLMQCYACYLACY